MRRVGVDLRIASGPAYGCFVQICRMGLFQVQVSTSGCQSCHATSHLLWCVLQLAVWSFGSKEWADVGWATTPCRGTTYGMTPCEWANRNVPQHCAAPHDVIKGNKHQDHGIGNPSRKRRDLFHFEAPSKPCLMPQGSWQSVKGFWGPRALLALSGPPRGARKFRNLTDTSNKAVASRHKRHLIPPPTSVVRPSSQHCLVPSEDAEIPAEACRRVGFPERP